MKNPDPLEKVIEAKVVDHAKAKGIIAYKFTSPSKRSVPDRLFVAPGGSMFLIEFKRRGQKPTVGQRAEITKLQQQGATVYVIDNIEDGKRAVDAELLKGY